MIIKKSITCLTLSLFFASTHAWTRHQPNNPKGCLNQGFEFKDSFTTIKPAKANSIFLLTNISKYPIQLQLHGQPKALYPKKMTSELYPRRWTSLSTMDAPQLQLSCQHVSEHGVVEIIDCASALHICQYTKVKFGEHNAGTYWVIQNKPRETIVSATITKGILLR